MSTTFHAEIKQVISRLFMPWKRLLQATEYGSGPGAGYYIADALKLKFLAENYFLFCPVSLEFFSHQLLSQKDEEVLNTEKY